MNRTGSYPFHGGSHDLEAIIGDDGGFRVSGQVRVAENDADMEALGARAAAMREHGYDHEKSPAEGRAPSVP